MSVGQVGEIGERLRRGDRGIERQSQRGVLERRDIMYIRILSDEKRKFKQCHPCESQLIRDGMAACVDAVPGY